MTSLGATRNGDDQSNHHDDEAERNPQWRKDPKPRPIDHANELEHDEDEGQNARNAEPRASALACGVAVVIHEHYITTDLDPCQPTSRKVALDLHAQALSFGQTHAIDFLLSAIQLCRSAKAQRDDRGVARTDPIVKH